MKSPFLEFLKNPFAFLREREVKRLRNVAWNEAYRLERKGQFREAAAVYRKLAEENRASNELMFASDLQEAIRLCLRAGDVATAVKDAGSVLDVLADSEWLEEANGYGAAELKEILGVLYVAGRAAEAEAYVARINARVAVFGWSMPAHDASAKRECPHCGAMIPASTSTTACEYCGGSVPGEERT